MYLKREKVRILLAKYLLSTSWLVNQLNLKGFNITHQVVNNYLSGRRFRGDANRVLDASIGILEEYGRLYGEKKE